MIARTYGFLNPIKSIGIGENIIYSMNLISICKYFKMDKEENN